MPSRKTHIYNFKPKSIQRDWLFRVEFVNPGVQLSNLTPYIGVNGYQSPNDELRLRCKDFQAPAVNIVTTKLYQLGKPQTFPVGDSIETEFSLTFEENSDQFILSYFNDWMNLANYVSNDKNNLQNSSEGDDWKTQVKCDIKVFPFDYDGSFMNKYYYLYDCYPTSLPGAKLDFASNSSVSYAVKFDYSYMEIKDTSEVPPEPSDVAAPYPAVVLPFLRFIRPAIAPPPATLPTFTKKSPYLSVFKPLI